MNRSFVRYAVTMWAQVSFVLSQLTRLTDRRADISLMARPISRLHSCSAVYEAVSVHRPMRSKNVTKNG